MKNLFTQLLPSAMIFTILCIAQLSYAQCPTPDPTGCGDPTPVSLDLREALENGTYTDLNGNLTVTVNRHVAGTASTVTTVENCSANTTFARVRSGSMDQNNLAAPLGDLTSADVLNNYIVFAWNFSKPLQLNGGTYDLLDFDYDHAGTDEFHDAASLVYERDGVLYIAPSITVGSATDESTITVGQNAVGGPNLTGFGTIPVFYNSVQIDGTGTNNVSCTSTATGATLDVGCEPIDALYLIYFNGIETDEPDLASSEMGVAFQNFTQNGSSIVCGFSPLIFLPSIEINSSQN